MSFFRSPLKGKKTVFPTAYAPLRPTTLAEPQARAGRVAFGRRPAAQRTPRDRPSARGNIATDAAAMKMYRVRSGGQVNREAFALHPENAMLNATHNIRASKVLLPTDIQKDRHLCRDRK